MSSSNGSERRRIVVLHGATGSSESVASNRHGTNNAPVSQLKFPTNSSATSSSGDPSTDVYFNSCISKCRMIMADLETTAVSLEQLIKEGSLSKAAIDLELAELQKMVDDFTTAHLEIIRICQINRVDTKAHIDRRQRFLVRHKYMRNQVLASLPSDVNQRLDAPSTSTLKLPRVEIPTFNGDFEQWSGWYRLFESLVHKNDTLDDMAKFSYLRSRLQGVPLTMVEGYPFSGEFYNAAFTTIVTHYNDPMKKISRLLDVLQQSPNMKDRKQTLRGLISLYRANATALKIIFEQNTEIDPLSQLLVHSFLSKADKGTRQDWEREVTRKKEFATFTQFIEYMEGRCNAYERAIIGSNSSIPTQDSSQKSKSSKVFATVQRKRKCHSCLQDHPLYKCPSFLTLAVSDRKKFVEEKKLCTRCLGLRCKRRCSIFCAKCKKGHNSTLHENKAANPAEPSKENSGNKIPINIINNLSTSSWIGNISNNFAEALLATVQLWAINSGSRYQCRALMDSASQPNLITMNLVKLLKLQPQLNGCDLNFVEQQHSSTRGCVQVQISARNTEFVATLWCEVVDNIIDLVPSDSFVIQNWKIPKNIILADSQFNIANKVDLLLGLQIFWKTLGTKKLNIGKNLPCLRSSKFGWLVTDDRDPDGPKNFTQNNVFVAQIRDSLSKLFERFWFIDESDSETLSYEELECEKLYTKTTTRTTEGCFVVRLPFGKSPQKLGQSRSLALKRFFSLERKFIRNPTLKIEYVACMNDYINLQHMREIDENLINKNLEQMAYYIPHHAVIKKTSTSTRLCAVFDASMLTSSGLSLNDCLMVGPVVQSDLVTILMRFRVHKIAFTADIVKMYRQVLLHPDDTRFQRIFWRENPTDPLKVYEIVTLAFGTSSAPFLATRCLKALADSDGHNYPDACNALLNDFYVDDVLTGADSVEKALKVQQQLQKILAGGGFILSKWCSNSTELLSHIPENLQESNFPFSLDKNDKVIKSLGLFWSSIQDSLRINVNIGDYSAAHSKRHILSIIASIFDPFGLLAPVTVIAKLLIQALWSAAQSPCSPNSEKHWDEKISEELWQHWIKFASNLHLLHKVSVPRYLFNGCNSILRIELHGFSDASEKAYGVAVYVKAIGHNEFSSCLYFAKSRVAPIKRQSLPRLELCAALLLSEIVEKSKLALTGLVKIDIIRLWTDSQIVLHWVGSASNRWLPFVANRVQKIQNLTNDCYWDYVNTKFNPADLISRGATPIDLCDSTLWWQGPEWLLNTEYFTTQTKFILSKKPFDVELRRSKRTLTFLTVFKSSIFKTFSNYWKLVKIVAWVSRFYWNAHWLGPQINGPLNIFELRNSVRTLVKLAQLESFSLEYKKLKSNSEIDKSSPLATLSPFLDHHNLIRVGGRLQNSQLTFDQQHPYILDPKQELSKLIIRYFHELHFHAYPQLLRSIIRGQFWILRINSAIRHCIINCTRCIREKAATKSQTMAALPKARVTPNNPFSVTGVDYAGPFSILGKGGKHKVVVKAYIAVFVCFSTKAIHLELVSDLTTEAFLAAFTRFISRRGVPVEVHSDNGTNFVGAKNLLKRQFTEFLKENSEKFSNFTASKGCQWHFIPSHAPHFGGLWEAGVKAVKGQLKFVLSKNTFTFEQWTTVLTQIEACLNSRPLIPDSTDPNELSALTPGHFLIGGPIVALPHPDLTNVPENRLKYWTLVKAQAQKFWRRWSNEYLNTLQQRSKWKLKKDNLKLNEIVIIREENSPPTCWPLGRIIELHTGADGHTRVVTLKTSSGIMKRPIVKIVPLLTERSD